MARGTQKRCSTMGLAKTDAQKAPWPGGGSRQWRLAHGRSLTLGARGRLMGILNVTPDSFSDGGTHGSVHEAVDAALRMVEAGADIIDIGGESTRPDAQPVSAQEEQRRVLPVITQLARRGGGVILSIDTYRASTARLAIEAGAHIVNDVWGAQCDPDIAAVAAETGAGICLMHTSRERQTLEDVIEDQQVFLERAIGIAREAGVAPEQMVLDPGFGFGKDTTENVQIMARFEALHALGLPLLVGTSRKRFLGGVTGRDAARERDMATVATTAILRMAGAAIFRVHAVAGNRDALAMADAVLAARGQHAGAVQETRT
jgi:dihydropteroate synthase